MNGRIFSPLRYPGGKNCIFNFMSALLYENNLIGIEYAEPYAGGSGLALHLLMEGYVSKIHLNDLDEWVYAFWYTILNNKNELCSWIRSIDVNVDNWKRYKTMLASPEKLDYFEKAKVFFFLNRTNVSGVIKGGAIGGNNQQGKYKIDVRFNKQNLIERIEEIHKLRSSIVLSNLDGIEFLKTISRKHRDIFIYIDPPYVNKGANLYLNFYSQKDHSDLSNMIRKINKRWLMSYDNCALVNDLYSDYDRVSYKLSQCTSNRIGEEMLIFSDNIIYNESIHRLNTPIAL